MDAEGRKQKGEQLDLFDGEYTYRCILTNDWDMTDEEIILHYNKRGLGRTGL